MKLILLITTLFLSLNTLAHHTDDNINVARYDNPAATLSITFPDGAETLKITALVHNLDTCNNHNLSTLKGWEKDSNLTYLGVISTEMACFTTAFKSEKLSTIVKRPTSEGTIVISYSTKSLSQVSLSFE